MGHRCIVLGRSPDCTATLAAVGVMLPSCDEHATNIISASKEPNDLVMSAFHSKGSMRNGPSRNRVWQHAIGLDMVHDLQAAASESLGWLQLEANRSPNTVRAYDSELAKLIAFLTASGHTLALADLNHDD